MTVALRTVSGLDVALDQKGIALAFGCDIVDPEPQPELVERAWVEL